jgi:hypothetical protein
MWHIARCTFLVLVRRGSTSVGQNDLVVRDRTGYTIADPILVVGAGAVGGDLSTTIGSIAGSVLSLAAPALTTVTAAMCGKLQNPGATTCKLLKPDLTLATLIVSNVSTGKFTAPFDTTLEGDHFVRWTGTGTATGAEERQFVVREERV